MSLGLEHWVPIGIAVAAVVVVPALIAFGKRLLTMWREARHARLAKSFVLRREMEMQFDQLKQIADRQHAENRVCLETIRNEALAREGRITAGLDHMRTEIRDDTKDLRAEVGKVHSRVDNVLELVGDRRRRT